MTVRISGEVDLFADLDGLADELDDLGMHRVAQSGEGLARGFAPRRSGRLAESLHAGTGRNSAQVSTQLVYAGPINYGWRRRNIRPARFMERAAQAWVAPAKQAIEAEIGHEITRRGMR